MTTNSDTIVSRREALKKTAKLLSGVAMVPLAMRSGALSAATSETNIAKAISEISPYSKLITVLSELIIPKTDTAGAIEAGA